MVSIFGIVSIRKGTVFYVLFYIDNMLYINIVANTITQAMLCLCDYVCAFVRK